MAKFRFRHAAAMAAAVVGFGMAAAQAVPYVWVDPTADANWLTGDNWSGSVPFVDDASNVCDINSGGTAVTGTGGSPSITSLFSGQINVNSGATLQQSGWCSATVGSLHLNGGLVTLGDPGSLAVTNGISVDADSRITSATANNSSLAAAVTGSGNLAFTYNTTRSDRAMSWNAGDSTSLYRCRDAWRDGALQSER